MKCIRTHSCIHACMYEIYICVCMCTLYTFPIISLAFPIECEKKRKCIWQKLVVYFVIRINIYQLSGPFCTNSISADVRAWSAYAFIGNLQNKFLFGCNLTARTHKRKKNLQLHWLNCFMISNCVHVFLCNLHSNRIY